MHISRFIKRIGIFGLCSLLIWLLFYSRVAPVATASDIRLGTVVGDLQPMAARDTEPTDLVALLNNSATRPLSLAAADLDEDGILDVIAGYRVSGGAANPGLLSVQRGNAAALYPNGAEAQAQHAAGTYTDVPILLDKALTSLPEAPDFLAAADFNGDGHADVLTGAAGNRVLYLLQGDGRGRLAAARPIALPGRLSGLVAGEFDAPDGLPEVLVALDGLDGARLAIFASPQGALADHSLTDTDASARIRPRHDAGSLLG